MMRRTACVGLCAALAACAGAPPQPPAGTPETPTVTPAMPSPPPVLPRPAGVVLACEGGRSLPVHLLPDEVHVTGLGDGVEVLLRDAGGVTPSQAVFSNPRWRAEFGLDADGRGVVLQELEGAQQTLRCRRG